MCNQVISFSGPSGCLQYWSDSSPTIRNMALATKLFVKSGMVGHNYGTIMGLLWDYKTA